MKTIVGLITNPHASRVTPEGSERARSLLQRRFTVVQATTRFPSEATAITRRLEDAGVAAVVVYAGDGTVNEVLNGIRRVPVGILAGGRTNVLARALGLPTRLDAALNVLASAVERNQVRTVRLGRANGRRFAFTSGVGLDAQFVRAWNLLPRRRNGSRPGDLAFAIATAKVMRHYGWRVPPVLEVEGMGVGAFVLVANCSPQSFLGALPLRFLPNADFNHDLDILLGHTVDALGVVRLFAHALLGHQPEHVLASHASDQSDVVVRSEFAQPLHVDGEDLGDFDHVVFESEPDAASFLIP